MDSTFLDDMAYVVLENRVYVQINLSKKTPPGRERLHVSLQDFVEGLRLVDGDRAAAANLALASALRTSVRVNIPTDRPLTVPEVAKMLRVRRDKVLTWIRSNRLRGFNVAEQENGRPKYRVNQADLEAFMVQRAVTQPARKGRPAGRRRRFPAVSGELPSL